MKNTYRYVPKNVPVAEWAIAGNRYRHICNPPLTHGTVGAQVECQRRTCRVQQVQDTRVCSKSATTQRYRTAQLSLSHEVCDKAGKKGGERDWYLHYPPGS